jgi:hypothetical protein
MFVKLEKSSMKNNDRAVKQKYKMNPHFHWFAICAVEQPLLLKARTDVSPSSHARFLGLHPLP